MATPITTGRHDWNYWFDNFNGFGGYCCRECPECFNRTDMTQDPLKLCVECGYIPEYYKDDEFLNGDRVYACDGFGKEK